MTTGYNLINLGCSINVIEHPTLWCGVTIRAIGSERVNELNKSTKKSTGLNDALKIVIDIKKLVSTDDCRVVFQSDTKYDNTFWSCGNVTNEVIRFNHKRTQATNKIVTGNRAKYEEREHTPEDHFHGEKILGKALDKRVAKLERKQAELKELKAEAKKTPKKSPKKSPKKTDGNKISEAGLKKLSKKDQKMMVEMGLYTPSKK